MNTARIPTVLFSIALASGLALGASACASSPTESASAPDTASSEPAQTTETAPADDTTTEAECDAGSVSTGSVPAGLPEGFPDIGVPFYADTTQMAATGDGDPYVLEYQSADDQETVSAFIADALVDNCWELLETTTEGTMSVNKAWTPGYSLVIAVGPDRADDSLTAIHYTLREQQEP